MKLLNVKLVNLFRHEETEIPLDRSFTLVQGRNGSGKSSIFETICYALFEMTIRWGKTKDKIVRRGQSYGWGIVDFIADNGIHYRVKRGRKGVGTSRSKNVLEFSVVDGDKTEPITEKTDGEINQEILNVVGCSWDVFRNSVMFGQNDNSKFVNAPEGERKSIIGDVLSFNQLDAALKIANERLSEQKSRLDKVVGKRAYLEDVIAGRTRKDIERGLAEAKEYDAALRTSIAQLEEGLEEANEAAVGFDQLLDAFHKTTKEVSSLERRIESGMEGFEFDNADEAIEIAEEIKADVAKSNKGLAKLEKRLDRARDNQSQIRATLEREQATLRRIESGECPTCGSEFDDADVGEQQSEVDRLVGEYQGATAAVDALKAQRDAIREQQESWLHRLNEVQGEISVRAGLQGLQDALESKEAERRKILKKMLPSGSETPSRDCDEKLDRLRKKQGDISARLGLLREDHAGAAEKIRQLDEINEIGEKYGLAAKEEKQCRKDHVKATRIAEIFGRAGVRHKLAEIVLPEIEALTNEYLAYLDDSDIYVEFSGTKEFKSGSTQDVLTVTVMCDGLRSNYEDYSGGEKKKILIASSLALSELVSRQCNLDFLLVDELFGSLDGIGRKQLSRLLQALRSKFSCVIVISHEGDVIEEFDDLITVIKTKGVSRVEFG